MWKKVDRSKLRNVLENFFPLLNIILAYRSDYQKLLWPTPISNTVNQEAVVLPASYSPIRLENTGASRIATALSEQVTRPSAREESVYSISWKLGNEVIGEIKDTSVLFHHLSVPILRGNLCQLHLKYSCQHWETGSFFFFFKCNCRQT